MGEPASPAANYSTAARTTSNARNIMYPLIGICRVIEALRVTFEEPHDHLNIKHDRMVDLPSRTMKRLGALRGGVVSGANTH